MNEVTIEHVKIEELPEEWRARLHVMANTLVTVRIEPEAAYTAPEPSQAACDDPAFGLWRDRKEMTDVDAYVRKLRQPRYRRSGSRKQI